VSIERAVTIKNIAILFSVNRIMYLKNVIGEDIEKMMTERNAMLMEGRSEVWAGRARAALVIVIAILGMGIMGGCSRGGDQEEAQAPEPPAKEVEQVEQQPAVEEEEPEEAETGTVNVLVAGLDKYGSADAILVVRISFDDKSVEVVSIPKYTRVDLPEYDSDRTISQIARNRENFKKAAGKLLGADIDFYAILNLDAAKRVVDSIGGVEVDVQEKLFYSDRAQKLFIDLEPGLQVLNGDQAVDYARFRGRGGENARMKRQAKLARAVFRKVSSSDMIPKLPDLVKTLIQNPLVETDITLDQAYDLVKQYDSEFGQNIIVKSM